MAFHAQVGLQNDRDLTPGVRIPATQEPGLYEHLRVEGGQHDVLDGGVSTILVFEPTARDNPEGVLNIVEGALQSGVRGLSVGCEDSEFVRITGYLVRRSDLEGARGAPVPPRHGRDRRGGPLEPARVLEPEAPERLGASARRRPGTKAYKSGWHCRQRKLDVPPVLIFTTGAPQVGHGFPSR